MNDSVFDIEQKEILNNLNPLEKKIIILFYKGFSAVEIGEKLNFSRAYVSRVRSNAKKKTEIFLKE